jgi:hypothetical protein
VKGGTAEPEETTIAGQRLSKYVSAATNTHATTDELLEAVLSVRYVSRLYIDTRPEITLHTYLPTTIFSGSHEKEKNGHNQE